MRKMVVNVRTARRQTVYARLVLLLTATLFTVAQVHAGELTVAAASDLNFAFKELVPAFEQQTGERVKLTLGSSGNFYAQIQNGAPFDLYFSADIDYPKKLIEAELALSDSMYQYARGQVVVWVPKDSKLDLAKGMEVLLEPTIKKIAIANPKHAPYGRAAVAAMKYFDVYDSVKDRLVLGENISQAAQFVESGSCDIGIVALSLALAPAMKGQGKYWEVPADAHPPLDQGAVILKSSKQLEAAKQFLAFLKRASGQEIMKRYGFILPQ